MVRRIYDLDAPEHFVAGTLGLPGQRTFYLQARGGGELVSVVLEKVQVAALAERLGALVREMRRRGVEVTDSAAPTGTAEAPLEQPVEEAFRAGTLSMTWDGETPEVVVEALALADDEAEEEPPQEYADDDPDAPDLLRVRITASQAEAFARQAERLVAAGRPLCPMCGQPLDPQGHLCPRRNGHGPYLN